jgi:hypothetical protein
MLKVIATMMKRFISWLISRTIEAWDDWRDPDWDPVYDPYTDSISNPTPRQIERLRNENTFPHQDQDPRSP